jgi:hypothetical protein
MTRPTSPISIACAASTPRVERAGGKLTMTAVLLKVLVGLSQVSFNASVDMVKRDRVQKYVHIGVAVDTDKGLLVPVIRDVDEEYRRDLRCASCPRRRAAEHTPRRAAGRRVHDHQSRRHRWHCVLAVDQSA